KAIWPVIYLSGVANARFTLARSPDILLGMETAHQIVGPAAPLSRAWYAASIGEFLQANPDSIIGRLASNSNFALLPTQRDAWLAQISLLQAGLNGMPGAIFLEFNIPRMGRRIDAVLLIGAVVFVVEFKVGEETFDRAALDQVWDYALDLKNFHEASHPVSLVPILIATGRTESPPVRLHPDEDKVYRPVAVHPAGFRDVIDLAQGSIAGTVLDELQWSRASYR